MKFNSKEFATDVKNKRGELSLRELSKELDISTSTLSRIENGEMPELLTYATLCLWMNESMSKYFGQEFNKILRDILTELSKDVFRGSMAYKQSDILNKIDQLK
jgi:transcriptional regulator with XRE-family HTH domain